MADKHLKWKQNIIAFFVSQGVSLFGSSLVQFAVIWYIAKTTSSGVMVTISIVCAFVPQVIISLFAGVWADRYNRKLLIIFADAGIAVATLISALMMINGLEFMWALMVISAVRSVGSGIQMPAVNALLPQIVPEEALMRVNGINGSVQSMINLVAPAVSGAILSYGAVYHIMFIDVVTAAIGIGMMLFIPIAHHKKSTNTEKADFFGELKEGLQYSLGNAFIRRLFLISIIYIILITPSAFLNVLMVTRTFGDSYWYLTINEMAFFVGTMIGGLLIGVWGGFKNRIAMIAFGMFFCGGFTVALGLIPVFWIYLIAMLLVGISIPIGNTPFMTLLQEKVHPDMQGRVFGLYQIIFSGFLPLGMAIFGPLADVVPIQWMIVATGAALMILAVLVRCFKSFYKEGGEVISTDE